MRALFSRIEAGLAWRAAEARERMRRRFPHRSVAYAILRARFSRVPLPPGHRVEVAPADRADRTFLHRQSAAFGPIFSMLIMRQYCVCVVGVTRGRQLLQSHVDVLRPITIEIEPLVPGGFLRQMQGDPHRLYRRALLKAIRSEDLDLARGAMLRAMDERLTQYTRASGDHGNTPAALREAMLDVSAMQLLRLFFGRDAGTPEFIALREGFQRLGPNGLVWDLGDQQVSAFTQLRDILRARQAQRRAAGDAAAPANCIFDRLADEDMLDDTMLGNLIYMVEMGRTDMGNFFGWLSRYVGANPAIADRMATGDDALAEAFVLETLRNNQSERLTRRALRDIEFDGVLIPRFAVVQICMWESHHDDARFPHPLQFDPTRFLAQRPDPESFSPFGLDQHICPFASIAVDLGVVFVRALTSGFSTTTVNDGPTVLGPHHWQPARDSSAALVPRS